MRIEQYFNASHIQQLPSQEFWILFFVALGLGGGAIISTFTNLKKARIIENTPTSKLRSAAQGYVEIIGFAEPMEERRLRAPLTQDSCLWYRYKVEEYRKSGKHSSWHTVSSGTSEDNFILNDETGLCVIDPVGADVHADKKDVWRGHSEYPSRGPGTSRSRGRSSSFISTASRVLTSTGRYRYTEERLHVNDTLYLLGNLETIGGSRQSVSIKELTRDVINVWKTDYKAMIQRFDANEDGEIDLDEWREVQAEARKDAEKQRADIQESPEVHIMNKPPVRNHPYIISTKDQEALCKRYRLISAVSCIVGVPVGAMGVWMFMVRLVG